MEITSATFDQVKAAYHSMKDSAEEESGPEGSLLWKGALTKLLERNGIPQSRYSAITKFLKDMGCIESARRGAGNVPSIWILWKEPTWDDFEAVKINRSPGRLKVGQIADLKQEVADLYKRVGMLEQRLFNAGIPTLEEYLQDED